MLFGLRRRTTDLLLLAALFAVALLLLPRGTLADTAGYANNDQDYYVFLQGMIDFDQVRQAVPAAAPPILGLPGDGSMYCVPTASSDLLAYVQAHGYALSPLVTGPGIPNTNWQDPAVYPFATLYIQNMGADMDTDAVNGTTSSTKILNAVRSRLAASEFDVLYYKRTNTWSPKATNIASYMFQGGIVQWAYGRWQVGGADDTPITREGGHAVVMTKVDKRAFQMFDDNEQRISFANPAGSSANPSTTQSNFVYQVEDTVDINYFLAGPGVFRKMTRILFSGTDARHRIMDSALAVFRKQGFFESPSDGTLGLWGGSFNGGTSNDGPSGYKLLHKFSLPSSDPLVGGAVSPDRGFAAFLTAGDPTKGSPGALYHLDFMTNQSTLVANVDGVATGLTFHRDRTCFVSSTTEIVRYEMDQDLPDNERALFWRLSAIGADAIAFDDTTDELLAVSLASNVVVRYTEVLREVSRTSFPSTLGLGSTLHSAAFNGPASLLLLIGGAGVSLLSQEEETGRLLEVGSFAPPTGSTLGGGSLGDNGQIFVIVDGAVQELEVDANGRIVATASPSPFAGLAASTFFEISRSRNNLVEEIHSGKGWENIPADELPNATLEEIPDGDDDPRPPTAPEDTCSMAAFIL